ncbi:MAG: hypothetical protein ACK4V2_07185 [Pseudomonadota bacterium]|jgi:hypothetical protein|nr:hypothetical protein [Alphaproteobacteria bacterium]
MKNIIALLIALIFIGLGIFLGLGIRTKVQVVEKPILVELTEKRTNDTSKA